MVAGKSIRDDVVNRERFTEQFQTFIICPAATCAAIAVPLAYLGSTAHPLLATGVIGMAAAPAWMFGTNSVLAVFGEYLAYLFTTFIVVFPLCCYGFTTLSRFYSKPVQSSHDGAEIDIERISNLAIGHAFKYITALYGAFQWFTNFGRYLIRKVTPFQFAGAFFRTASEYPVQPGLFNLAFFATDDTEVLGKPLVSLQKFRNDFYYHISLCEFPGFIPGDKNQSVFPDETGARLPAKSAGFNIKGGTDGQPPQHAAHLQVTGAQLLNLSSNIIELNFQSFQFFDFYIDYSFFIGINSLMSYIIIIAFFNSYRFGKIIGRTQGGPPTLHGPRA